ncbi:hypothetical protein VTN00DRAFT_709 [Thermoascus crustaceus]|uniref:uncharacterized protein n=1 Tax=Thermoascus crustaceus TaxID=5088 RepID=UPI003741EF40
MALKRKASFTMTSSSNATPSFPGAVVTLDEPPRHLNSRTRKRFRNDRPDDQTVYENTLRWLFSAQKKQQQVTSLPMDEDMSMSLEPSEPEPFDPRQQTLHKFFQPARTVSSSTNASSIPQQTDSIADVHTMRDAADTGSATSSVKSGSGSPSSQIMDLETYLEMECRQDGSECADKRWVGGIRWM